MADLRLIAAAVAVAVAVALAGCGPAGAAPDPASGLTPPAGWQALPAIAAAAKGALGPGAKVLGAEAWGEPAMGCYAVWLAIQAQGTAEAVGRQIVAGFTAAAAGSAPAGSAAGAGAAGAAGAAATTIIKDVAAPAGEQGELSLAFERGDHRGRLRARLGGGQTTALACFANQREPLACEAACAAFLGGLR